jgi:hypothetical protein
MFSEIEGLVPTFETVDIPWIEHGYKTRFNLTYQALGREHRYLTRTRRKSALICKLSDLLKLLYIARTRKIAPLRSRLALLEISHRRRCAGRVGTFSMGEFRSLVGGTRITDQEVLALLKNPKVDVSENTLHEMAKVLGQERLDRPVWIPRRLVRHLAAHGSRLEIAASLTLAARRMVNRFGRARVSARMVAELAGANEKHVRSALESLQFKRLLIKNKQAERWSVNRWGSLYDFPEDLSIDPLNEQKPLRAPPRRRTSMGFSPRSHGVVLSMLVVSGCPKRPFTGRPDRGAATPSTQKGANLINPDPSSLLEQQQSLAEPLQMAPPNAEHAAERRRLGLLAKNLWLDRGEAGAFYRNAWSNLHTPEAATEALSVWGFDHCRSIRRQFPPHRPAQAPWRKKAA